MTTLICDCDGVLLLWRPTFIDWCKKYGFLAPDIPDHVYDFTPYLKIPGSTHIPNNFEFSNALSNLFNESFHLKNLPPMPGAAAALRYAHSNGAIIKVVSSYTSEYKAMKSREENLVNVFGNIFQEIVSLPLRSSKKEWLSTQDKNAIFIEDSINNINDAISVGFDSNKCYLIAHDYNELPDDVKYPCRRVDWFDVPRIGY